MTLRPFFSYFGSKWRLALQYPKPTEDWIVEPFAGSACYALRHHERQVFLVEKNPHLVALWQFLIKSTPDEIRALPLIRLDQEVADLRLDSLGAEMLIRFWLARGIAGDPPTRPNAWMQKHAARYPGCFWGPTIRERIARQVDAIRHWQVIEGDYSESPDVEATWFVDPPYQVAGAHYTCGAGEIHFETLAAFCRSRRGQVLVCENQGASWLPFRPFALTKGTRKPSQEVLWSVRQ